MGKITYTLTPLFAYELRGMVVSYHDASAWWDIYHRQWGDLLNLKDLCVVWGQNLKTGVYEAMSFSSGSWTCYAQSKPGRGEEAAANFRNNCLSNNHLLATDKEIQKKILKVRKGDQVYFKGYLAEYSQGTGFRRGSSTSRDDQGNGACETVYVTDFEILHPANPILRMANQISEYSIIGCLLILFLLSLKLRAL